MPTIVARSFVISQDGRTRLDNWVQTKVIPTPSHLVLYFSQFVADLQWLVMRFLILVTDCSRRGFSLQAILPQRLPANTQLLAHYPNPSNPETWIPFDLSQDTTVTIGIYDVQGQRIRRLQLGQLTAGRYVTADQAAYGDGKTEEGEAVASSTDFFRLKQKIIRKHERR